MRYLPLAAVATLSLLSACGPAEGPDDLAELTDEETLATCGPALSIASLSATHVDAPNVEANVLDGNLNTRWSGLGVGTSLTAKLGAPTRLCSVSIAWYRGDQRVNHFVLSTSTDGKTFTQVLARDSSGATLQLETYPLPSGVDAAYVRITVNGNTENTWASLTEVRVTGAAVSSGKPGPGNTGIPAGTILTRLNGDVVIDATWMSAHPTGVPAGAGAGVMQNQDIYGSVRVKVPNFTLRRSRVRGKQVQLKDEWTALVFVTVGSAAADQRSSVVIEDCEVAPTYPSSGSTGIYGYNFTARRNNVHHTVDGFGLHYYTRLTGNWVHALTFFDSDGSHTNGTHNDGAQLHKITSGPFGGRGGGNVITGNFFEAFIAQDAGTPGTQHIVQPAVLGQGFNHQAMSAFMINANAKNTVTDNWLEGGYMLVNAGDLDNAGLDLGTWQRNQFDRMRTDNPAAYYGVSSYGSYARTPPYSMVFKAGAIVNTGAGTSNRNTFAPGSVTPGVTGGAEVQVKFY